jgi:hypothetical protein
MSWRAPRDMKKQSSKFSLLLEERVNERSWQFSVLGSSHDRDSEKQMTDARKNAAREENQKKA